MVQYESQAWAQPPLFHCRDSRNNSAILAHGSSLFLGITLCLAISTIPFVARSLGGDIAILAHGSSLFLGISHALLGNQHNTVCCQEPWRRHCNPCTSAENWCDLLQWCHSNQYHRLVGRETLGGGRKSLDRISWTALHGRDVHTKDDTKSCTADEWDVATDSLDDCISKQSTQNCKHSPACDPHQSCKLLPVELLGPLSPLHSGCWGAGIWERSYWFQSHIPGDMPTDWPWIVCTWDPSTAESSGGFECVCCPPQLE